MCSSSIHLQNNIFSEVLEQSTHATAIYTSADLIIGLANPAMLLIWGKNESVVGMRFEDALPEMKAQPFTAILKNVWQTGQAYHAADTAATMEKKGIWCASFFDFVYQPIKDANGNITCILHTAVDVSERVMAWNLISEKKKLQDRLNEELQSANKEFSILNQEYQAINAELQERNQKLEASTAKLLELNRTIAEGNITLTAANDNLRSSHDEIFQLNEKFSENEKHLQGILDTMAEGVGVTDHLGKLIYANPRAQEILGLSHSEILDRVYDDPRWQNIRLDGSDLPPEEHPMSIMMRTGRPVYDHEIGVRPPGCEPFYISINAAPIFNSKGELTGGIGTFMDVTTRRMIIQGKDDFISIASHELKTPVTSLKASLQLLERSHQRLTEDNRGSLIAQAIKSLDNLSRLINDLLDTSRVEQGHLKLELSHFSIQTLFENCSAHVMKGIKQDLRILGDTSQVIRADMQQISQVLVNLINNALKYAPDSDQIILHSTAPSESEIKIMVKDFGPGIEKEKLDHLFERYYRTSYKGQKFSGLGLGLYISAAIIKNHGGKIGVESQPGEGSTFWFTLPVEVTGR